MFTSIIISWEERGAIIFLQQNIRQKLFKCIIPACKLESLGKKQILLKNAPSDGLSILQACWLRHTCSQKKKKNDPSLRLHSCLYFKCSWNTIVFNCFNTINYIIKLHHLPILRKFPQILELLVPWCDSIIAN